MSIVITEGFDMYSGITGVTGLASRWNLSGTAFIFSLGTGRWFGGQCLTVGWQNTVAGTQKLFLGNNYTSFSFGCGWRANISAQSMSAADVGGSGFGGGIYFNVGATTQIMIRGNENNALEVWRVGSSTALGTTVSGTFLVGTWHYLEVECVISDSVGRVTLYLDGEQVLNLTSQDTKAHATLSYVDNITIGYPTSFVTGISGFNISVDDIYFVNTATRLGECRIETIRPDSDYSLGWTPDTGSVNYSRVNETLASASNYVTTNTLNARDLYGMGNLAVNPEAIYAVVAVSFAKKTDATTRGLSNSIQSNGVDSYGTTQYLNASDNRYDNIYELNPDGSVAWTYSSVNALKAGPKLVL